jgi:hypothetical protein
MATGKATKTPPAHVPAVHLHDVVAHEDRLCVPVAGSQRLEIA